MMVQPPHATERYDNNRKGWYFRSDGDNKMRWVINYKYILSQSSKLKWASLEENKEGDRDN